MSVAFNCPNCGAHCGYTAFGPMMSSFDCNDCGCSFSASGMRDVEVNP